MLKLNKFLKKGKQRLIKNTKWRFVEVEKKIVFFDEISGCILIFSEIFNI
jgi:hypothetical protein